MTINIHAAGFRLVGAEQGPWPPDPEAINVMVFGASIVLSLALLDDETIGAALQRDLRVRTGLARINVYAFGVGAFLSSQQVIYLQNLLRDGIRPDMVVFVNDGPDMIFWDGEPSSAGTYRDAQRTIQELRREIGREHGVIWHAVELARSLPVVRLAERRREQRATALPRSQPPIFDPSAPPTLGQPAEALYARYYQDPPAVTDRGRIDQVLTRYRTNMRIGESIAEAFGIEPLFLLVPNPLYKYDLALHPFRLPDDARRARYGYPVLRRQFEQGQLGIRFVWCADAFEQAGQPMYLDRGHYNAAGAAAAAQCAAAGIVSSGALDRRLRLRAARQPVPSRETPVGPLIARLFTAGAQAEQMALPEHFADAETLDHEGIRLVDDADGYASMFEDIPLAGGDAERLYEASIRIKPAGSPLAMLVMSFLGGTTRSYTVGIDLRTMRAAGGSGLYAIEPVNGGWYRVVLAGAGDPQATTLRVQLYPRHGDPQDRGDIIFGGGEVRLRPAAPTRAAGD